MKKTEGFDGYMIFERHQAHTSHTQVHTITKTNSETAVNEQFNELTTIIETLDQRYVDNKPTRSGWPVVASDKLLNEIRLQIAKGIHIRHTHAH